MLQKGVNADTDKSVKDRLIMNSSRLALETASLQWVGDEKELSVISIESSRVIVPASPSSYL